MWLMCVYTCLPFVLFMFAALVVNENLNKNRFRKNLTTRRRHAPPLEHFLKVDSFGI